MRLEDIGFYTLSDYRAGQASIDSPMWRCELILTDRCNFKCPYCRGVKPEYRGSLSWQEACETVDYWMVDGLKNIRFSGGEPTLWHGLRELVERCRHGSVERIAISTNGSAETSHYLGLIHAGVNDISISLDACFAQTGNKMAGREGVWERIVENIRVLSTKTYVTVGMVFTEDNIADCVNAVLFADSLGVADIRVVPSAQYNKALAKLSELPARILSKYPILKYRITNVGLGRNVRTMRASDTDRCHLVKDDSVIMKGLHFPCIIYMREGGEPIGRVSPDMRTERLNWFCNHNSQQDPICKEMCLDVCIDYNNKAELLGGCK